MRPSIVHIGGVLYWVILTRNPDTMLLKNADSTPTVSVRKNGASVGDSVTITKRSATTGIYDCSYDPAGEVEGDAFTLQEAATITGTTTAQATYNNNFSIRVLETVNAIKLNTDYPDDCVYLDPTNGVAGTVVGVNGTISNPSDTFVDAAAIATSRGVKNIKFAPHIGGSVNVLTGSYPAFNIDLNGANMMLDNAASIIGYSNIYSSTAPSIVYPNFGTGQTLVEIASDTRWNNVSFASNVDIEDFCYMSNCVIGLTVIPVTVTLSGISGMYPVYLQDCYTAKKSGLTFNCSGGIDLILNGWYGDFTVTNLTAGTTIQVYGYAKVTLDASCTGGTFRHTSHVEVTDNSGGAVTVDLISQSSDSTIITAVSNLQTSVNTIDDFLDTEMPALTLAVAQIHDRTGYTLTILAGVISNAGTATETYVLTINSVVYTADYAGLDEGGNRGATTLSKV